ncbi:ABC transporter permease [Agromyces archimandritae]|uniref:ABC transporter permease n=1 Tax=Agromyces archimandritae TaxID=2781962 RepID=A0A975FM70_9MICO|nr:ABC transporter permease [Agromyces archimandritae]QTX05028.1 ABC transporter permease [Agromyces archimandritae]
MNTLARLATRLVSTVVEALEELRIHRGRVLLSLVGVAVAVCALATVVGAAAIAEQGGRETQERAGGRPATIQFSVGTPDGALDTASFDAAWATVLDRYEVDYSSRNVGGTVRTQFADGVVAVPVQAVDADYGVIHRLQLQEGRWFVDRDADRLAPAIVVNSIFWDRMGRPPLATHPTVELATAPRATAVVIGVQPPQQWEEEPSAIMLYDAYAAVAPPAGPASDMMGFGTPSYEAWVGEEIADPFMQRVSEDLQAETAGGVTVDGYRTDYAAWGEDPYLMLKLLVGGVAAVILLLGALGLLNIALVTVRTRIREIGVRRSFGATGGRVFFSVLMESVVGTFLAGVVGVGVSILLVKSPLMDLVLGGTVEDLPGFPVEAAVLGIGSAVAVGALAGLLPALAAVRVKVIDAIRF